MGHNEEKKQTNHAYQPYLLSAMILILILASVLWIQIREEMQTVPRETSVAYLYPLSAPVQDIWVAPLIDPTKAQAVTTSKMGIYDFGVSADGRYIAYSERDEETRLLDLYLLDLKTMQTRRISTCAQENTQCHTPIFHPKEPVIAYINRTVQATSEQTESGLPRVWVMNIETLATYPLVPDPETMGHSPRWSDDGNSIAFFTQNQQQTGIIIYNFGAQESDLGPSQPFIPSEQGSIGALSPNGRKLIFPALIERPSGYFSYLKIVDLEVTPPLFTDFTDPQASIEDVSVDWHPDGEVITIQRRYYDERATPGFQLYNIDIATREVLPLLVDSMYSHHYFAWNRTGDHLVVQRISQAPPAPTDTTRERNRPEIWVLTTHTGATVQISDDAYHPRWIESPSP